IVPSSACARAIRSQYFCRLGTRASSHTLGPLASARREPELHSGGRPDAAAAAERLEPCPSADGSLAGERSKGGRISHPGDTSGSITRPAASRRPPEPDRSGLGSAGAGPQLRRSGTGAMSERSFYQDRAKREAKAAVVAIEAQTSAEVVVCLRGSS